MIRAGRNSARSKKNIPHTRPRTVRPAHASLPRRRPRSRGKPSSPLRAPGPPIPIPAAFLLCPPDPLVGICR